MNTQSPVQAEPFLHIPETVSKQAQDFLRVEGPGSCTPIS